jgi:hypothetical protein
MARGAPPSESWSIGGRHGFGPWRRRAERLRHREEVGMRTHRKHWLLRAAALAVLGILATPVLMDAQGVPYAIEMEVQGPVVDAGVIR